MSLAVIMVVVNLFQFTDPSRVDWFRNCRRHRGVLSLPVYFSESLSLDHPDAVQRSSTGWKLLICDALPPFTGWHLTSAKSLIVLAYRLLYDTSVTPTKKKHRVQGSQIQ